MSSYSSASLSSYDPASSSNSEIPSSPSTSPGTSPPSPLSLKSPTFPRDPQYQRARTQTYPLTPPPPIAPPQPRTRALTLDARPHGIGVDPSALVGKKLARVRRSRTNPCITLHCADGSAFQVLVVGYDPQHRGIPKVLESDSPVLNPRGAAESAHADLRLTISHAASITLSDKAFQARPGPSSDGGVEGLGLPKVRKQREDRWTQRHAAFALKFEEEQGWHCVWATMSEYDEQDRDRCVFRNYADVYLDRLPTPAPSTPTSVPAHRTSFAQSHPAASIRGDSPTHAKPQGRGNGHGGRGRRRNQKRKSGPGPGHGPGNGNGSSSPSPRSTPKARW